jgi:type IV pilus assembly protein PilE
VTGRHAVPRPARGFTLIELLITVAVGIVLVMIAAPAYQDRVRQTRRTDGYNMLLEAANRQVRYYADNESYTASLTALGYAADPAASPEGFYQLTAAVTANGYVLTATPVGAQAADTQCGTLTYDSLGTKGASGTGDCWN